jgi:hypothetical protein
MSRLGISLTPIVYSFAYTICNSEAEVVIFLQQIFDLSGPLQRKKKAEIEEMMKNQFRYHAKNISTSSDAAMAQSFVRIFEPDGFFFVGTSFKNAKYLVMIGASWIFKRVGIVSSKDVS